MKLIQKLTDVKNLLLVMMLLTSLVFVYGCQCEGSIGNSSQNTQTINTQTQSK